VSRKGLFVSLEGGEGSGKSTQARILTERAHASGIEAHLIREPGGTPLGEELRRLLLHGGPISPQAELLLFLAARAELVESVIRPLLNDGALVVCDRFSDSTLSYQGYGRGLDVAAIRSLNRWATGGLEPDLTFLLDISVELGRHRKLSDRDTFARQDDPFHVRVRQGYHFLAASAPERWVVLDGSEPVEVLAEMIWSRIQETLEVQGDR
jgi:dTMP kinase